MRKIAGTTPKSADPLVKPGAAPASGPQDVDAKLAAHVSRWARAGYLLLPVLAALLLAVTLAFVPRTFDVRAIMQFAFVAVLFVITTSP